MLKAERIKKFKGCSKCYKSHMVNDYTINVLAKVQNIRLKVKQLYNNISYMP